MLGGFEKATGVDNGDVGIFRESVNGVARLHQDASDFFAVDVVLGAAEGDDFYIGCGHDSIMKLFFGWGENHFGSARASSSNSL